MNRKIEDTKYNNPDLLNEYIQNQSQLELLRFITCGSVDDGKSTLIGKILYEAQLIFDDQIALLENDSKKTGTQFGKIDYALLVDGLSAEREQGITIDVAYRFFNTDKRKFIVADTPGHEQYTRNMVTGASLADVAIILVDAENGILTQTRRHSFIASMLGIEHVVLAVNKMDLVDYSETKFQIICDEFLEMQASLNFKSVTYIPLSALNGDNVIVRSDKMNWYHGPTLMGFLETVKVRENLSKSPFRFPVQWVNRPNSNFRGFSGTVASGRAKRGELVKALPSGEIAKIDQILLYKDNLEIANTDHSVTIVLDRNIDLSRGDVIVASKSPCEISDLFEAKIVWMDKEKGYIGRQYIIQIGTSMANASLTDIKFKYDVNTFEKLPSKDISLNEIATIELSLDKEIAFEKYENCPGLGSFILIDRFTNSTVAAGMINFSLRRASNIHRQKLIIDRKAREKLSGHKGRVVWLTGLSGSGKSTIADATEKYLHNKGFRTYILDGDNIRHGLSKDLGFTNADRVENIRRISEVAKLMMEAGMIVFTAFISPFKAEREMAKNLFKDKDFLEIFIDTPLELAEKRDPKGLYKKARSGDLPNFTGIDSAYEVPDNPDLVIDTSNKGIDESARLLGNLILKLENEKKKH